MSATTLASSILVMAEADNFMKVAQAKMSMGNIQNAMPSMNNLKDTSIFAMNQPKF